MPLPPAAKGIPFIGDTFEYIRDGPSCGQKHHEQLGSIYRFACHASFDKQWLEATCLLAWPHWMLIARSWLLGERIIHVGDSDACKLLMTCEHDLVEGMRAVQAKRHVSMVLYARKHTALPCSYTNPCAQARKWSAISCLLILDSAAVVDRRVTPVDESNLRLLPHASSKSRLPLLGNHVILNALPSLCGALLPNTSLWLYDWSGVLLCHRRMALHDC